MRKEAALAKGLVFREFSWRSAAFAALTGLLTAAIVAIAWAVTPDNGVARLAAAICAGMASASLAGLIVWRAGGLARESAGAGLVDSRAERQYLIPRDLPPPPPGFVGRQPQIERMRNALEPDHRAVPPLAVLHGPAGIGKTALALSVAHQLADSFPDGQIFMRVVADASAPAHTATLDAVVFRLLKALNGPTYKIPDSSGERLEAYKRLAQQRPGLLIVLDNVPYGFDVAPLMSISSKSAVIVTARERPDNLEPQTEIRLEPLGEEEALALLMESIGEQRIDEAEGAPSRLLVERCQKEPLALRLAGAALASRPGWRLSDVALMAGLATDSPQYSAPSSAAIGTEDEDPLDVTYGLLTPDEQKALRCVGAMDRLTFTDWALRAVLDAVPQDDASALAARLNQALLIERTTIGPGGVPRYEVPEPVRDYARSRAAREDPPDTLRQRAARLQRARNLRQNEEPRKRIRRDVYPLMRAGRLNEAAAWARDAIDLARSRENPAVAEAEAFAALAELYADVGEVSAAEDAAGHALAGTNASQSRAMRCHAKLHRMSHSWLAANRYLDQALKLAQEADDTGEQIRVLADRAVVLAARGRHDLALEDARQSGHLCRENGETTEQPVVSLALGIVHLYAKRYDDAQAALDRGYQEARELGYQLWMAWIGLAQGRVAIERRDPVTSAAYANGAASTFIACHHRYGLAHCRYLMGQAQELQLRHRQAADTLLTALEGFNSCGDRWVEAEAELALARVYLRLGLIGRAASLQRGAARNYVGLDDRGATQAAYAALLATRIRGLFAYRIRHRQLAPAAGS